VQLRCPDDVSDDMCEPGVPGKGKGHPITDHEGPRGGVVV
jgi:hypothetical protein